MSLKGTAERVRRPFQAEKRAKIRTQLHKSVCRAILHWWRVDSKECGVGRGEGGGGRLCRPVALLRTLGFYSVCMGATGCLTTEEDTVICYILDELLCKVNLKRYLVWSQE